MKTRDSTLLACWPTCAQHSSTTPSLPLWPSSTTTTSTSRPSRLSFSTSSTTSCSSSWRRTRCKAWTLRWVLFSTGSAARISPEQQSPAGRNLISTVTVFSFPKIMVIFKKICLSKEAVSFHESGSYSNDFSPEEKMQLDLICLEMAILAPDLLSFCLRGTSLPWDSRHIHKHAEQTAVRNKETCRSNMVRIHRSRFINPE